MLVQYCWGILQERLDFGNGGIQQRELVCRCGSAAPPAAPPPPPAIIHSRGTPHEADDGCLACGSSTLAALRQGSCKKWEMDHG